MRWCREPHGGQKAMPKDTVTAAAVLPGGEAAGRSVRCAVAVP